jgi:hypothetical protein
MIGSDPGTHDQVSQPTLDDQQRPAGDLPMNECAPTSPGEAGQSVGEEAEGGGRDSEGDRRAPHLNVSRPEWLNGRQLGGLAKEDVFEQR